MNKRKRGLETSARILETAAALFARKGLDGVSLREIAAGARLRESSLYNHFKGKQDILRAIIAAFAEQAPLSRLDDAELDRMLGFMGPEEIFKAIVFQVGARMTDFMANAAAVIFNERARQPQAAEAYEKYLVQEPERYYTRLIQKMMAKGMVKEVDASLIAEQYNTASLLLTQDYFMAQNGFGNTEDVVRRMVRTLTFFCALMR